MTRALAALIVIALAGCAYGDDARPGVERVCGPDVRRVPCGPGVEEGVSYRFQLLTHCGIEWAYLDGRYWVPSPQVDPPPDWAAIEEGAVTLRSGAEVVFEADEGGEARFVPAPAQFRPRPCA